MKNRPRSYSTIMIPRGAKELSAYVKVACTHEVTCECCHMTIASREVAPCAVVFRLHLMAREGVHLNRRQEGNEFRVRGRGSVGVTMML
jgi:hypothetical protein